jgi:hypothetical protein
MNSRGTTRSSGVGGVSKKLKEEGFVNWIMPYFDKTSLEGIVANRDKPEEQMTILNNVFDKAQLPESFTEDFYVHEKQLLIKKLEMHIINDNPEFAEKKQRQDLGISEVHSEEYSIENESPESKKKKSATNGNRKWSKKEELVIKTRLADYKSGKIKLSDIQASLKKTSGKERSKNSIRKKIKRMNNE